MNVPPSYPSRLCPVCETDSASPDEVFSEPRAESLDFDALKPYWNGFFKEKVLFSYARCRDCGLLYCPRYFTEPQLEELYGQMPDNTAGVPTGALQKTQAGYFDILKTYSPLRGDYLELGPDIGLFTECCLSEGRLRKYWLIEPNRAVWDTLKAKMSDVPYELLPDASGYDTVPKSSLSVVSMVHVLDHLPEPRAALRQLRGKLAKGAVLLIVTHDEASWLAQVVGRRWPPYCLQHPQLYGPHSITRLLEAAGYRVVAIRKTQNHFPITYLLQHAFWAAGVGKFRLPALEGAQVGLRLGNMATVAMPR